MTFTALCQVPLEPLPQLLGMAVSRPPGPSVPAESASPNVSVGRATCPPVWATIFNPPSRVQHLSPQGVLLPQGYRTIVSPLWLELRGPAAWQATPCWTVYRLACHWLSWLRVTFAMVSDAAWPSSDHRPWGNAPSAGLAGRLGRPSASWPWGAVRCHMSLGRRRRSSRALKDFQFKLPLQAVTQCIVGVALPTACRRCRSGWHELQCPLSKAVEAVHCKSSIVRCPQTARQSIGGAALSSAASNVVVHCRCSTAERRKEVKQCIAEVAFLTATTQTNSAIRKLHCPLSSVSVAMHCRYYPSICPQSMRRCIRSFAVLAAPRAVRQFVARVPMPTALRR